MIRLHMKLNFHIKPEAKFSEGIQLMRETDPEKAISNGYLAVSIVREMEQDVKVYKYRFLPCGQKRSI